MATLNTRDPVQGLIDYVSDIKPFHSKILEVWVEYIYNDAVNGTIADHMDMVVDIVLDRATKACKYGFDSQPWNEMIGDLSFEEMVPGSITYATDKSVTKAEAYRLYHAYMLESWKWMNGLIDTKPEITKDSTSKYFLLSYTKVFNACRNYFSELANGFQYWFEPSAQKVYKRVGNAWHEQPAYVSTVHPPYPVEQDLWLSTTNNSLFMFLGGSWEEIRSLHISYSNPKSAPPYPVEWMSNWDAPDCMPPFGETYIYTYVQDQLEFDHGSEIFLSDRIRGMVYDPTGENNTTSGTPGDFTKRTEYPIKYRTTVTQDPSGRYKIQRAEVSILTEPNNPEIVGKPYTVHLDGMEFEGFGLDRQRKGVRLNEFLVWKFKSQTEGMQLIADSIINRDTFGFRVDNGQLIAQKITTSGRTDVDCPFADGQVVYFSSPNGNLPEYRLLSQESRTYTVPRHEIVPDPDRPGQMKHVVINEVRDRNVTLMPYVPYRIKHINARQFSVVLLRAREQYDPITGQRIPSTDIGTTGYKTGNTPYEPDLELMGSSPYLNFVTPGHGDMFFGIGHPVPFIETRQTSKDLVSAKFRDGISSTTESFLGSKYVTIDDVLIGFNDHGVTRNAFVIVGNYPLKTNEIIRVANSSSSANDGDWIITQATVWSNKWIATNSDGTFTPAPKPDWWNELKMGSWPLPTKRPQTEIDQLIQSGQYEDEYSEYNYFFVTTLGVSGTAPSIQFPHGSVVFSYYAFGEPHVGPNIAAAQVKDVLRFGSYVLTEMPDGSFEMIPEKGTPGVAIDLKDTIKVTIQEQLEPNKYGIPTIGSFGIHYYDVHSSDGGLENT